MFLSTSNEVICAGQRYTLGNNACFEATRVRWEILGGPASSTVIFDNPDSAFTDIIFPNAGRYTLQRCCFFDEGGEPNQPTDGQVLINNCPNAAIEGDSFTLLASGCNGTATWTSTGPVSVLGISSTQAAVTVTGPGAISIKMSCERVDPESGDIEVVEVLCEFTAYSEDQEFDTETTPFGTFTSRFCGTSCVCEEEDIIVEDCSDQECLEFKFGVTFKYCPPPIEKGVVEVTESKALTGTRTIAERACSNVIEKLCEPDICCDPHQPVILWNDVMNCGWTMTASNSANGTVIASAAGCNVGKKWCAEGPVDIVMSGPSAFVDTLVIYGHSLEDATITTAPFQEFGGQPKDVGVYFDSACMEGYTKPIIIYFNEVNDSIEELTIRIETEGVFCINHIFAGQKKFLPSIPDSWVNPFNGSDREIDIREGDCGPVSITSKRRMMNMELPIDCVSEAEFNVSYRPLIRYLSCGNPFMFSWSINNYPDDMFYGWINPNDGTPYDEGIEPILTISARGFISQAQPKDFT